MDARALRDKMAAKEKDLRSREFCAPYTDRSKQVVVKIDGVLYPLRIVGQSGSGFGVFSAIDGTCARFVREAEFDQSREYLDSLPQIHFILAFESDQGWVAYPMNAESAKSSLGLLSEAVVKNVVDAERFDAIVARWDGRNFWYDGLFMGDLAKAEAMRDCFRADFTPDQMKRALGNLKGLTPEDKETFRLAMSSWAQFKVQTTESRLKSVLAEGGGRLGSYVLRGINFEVRWQSESGETYVSIVDKDTLDVVTAGICLEGEDEKFNLKDLPHVMREGENRGLIYRTRFERDFAVEHTRDLA